jgi:hypothetical protein
MRLTMYAAAALAFLLLLAGAYWKGRIDESANTRVAEARIADRDALIEAQNDAMAKLRAEGVQRLADAKKALKAAQAVTAKNRETVAETLDLQPVGDECRAAEALLGTVQ